MDTQQTIDRAISTMENWARDDSHGYDQAHRWGERGDYDCSAAVGSSVYVHTILCINEHGQACFNTPMVFEHIQQGEQTEAE